MSDPVDDLLAAPDAPSAPPRRKRAWVKYLKLALLIAVLGLVAWAFIKQWHALATSNVEVHVRVLPLIGAVLSLIAVACVQLLSYRALLSAYATAPRWRAMPTIAWVPAMGKYVPAAAPVAATALLSRFGIALGPAVAVVLTLDGLAVIAGLITGAPLLLWKPVAEHIPHLWIIAIPIVVGGIIALAPPVFVRALNLLLRKLKKQPLQRVPRAIDFIVPATCAFAQWVFTGLGLLCILLSVANESPAEAFRQLPLMISFAALSQTIGYLAIFAPGGVGVRDIILLVCFTPLVGPLAAVIVPIRMILQIVIEVSLAGIGLAASRNATAKPVTSEA